MGGDGGNNGIVEKSEKKNKKEKKSSKDKKEKKKESKKEKKSKKNKKKIEPEEKEYDLNLASPLPSSRPGVLMMTYDDEMNPTPYRTKTVPPPTSPGKMTTKK